MAKIEVSYVDRANGRVEIAIGPFKIVFAENDGKVRKISVTRDDKNRIANSGAIWIPRHLFNSAARLARQELLEGESVVTEKMMRSAAKAEYRHRRVLGNDY